MASFLTGDFFITFYPSHTLRVYNHLYELKIYSQIPLVIKQYERKVYALQVR